MRNYRCRPCGEEFAPGTFTEHVMTVHGGPGVGAAIDPAVSDTLEPTQAQRDAIQGGLAALRAHVARTMDPIRAAWATLAPLTSAIVEAERAAQLDGRVAESCELFPPIPAEVIPYSDAVERDHFGFARFGSASRLDTYDRAEERRLLADVDSMGARLEDPEPGQDAEEYVHPEPYPAVKGWYWVRCTDDFRAMNSVRCEGRVNRPWVARFRGSVPPRMYMSGAVHDHLVAFTGTGEFLEMIDTTRYGATRTEEGIQE